MNTAILICDSSIRRCDVRTVLTTELLQAKASLIKEQDGNKRAALHYAAAMGDVKMVDFLLSKDTFTIYEANSSQQAPIHLVAENGQVSMLMARLDSCLDTVKLLKDKQQNSLCIAAKRGNFDVVTFILILPEMEDLVKSLDVEIVL